jgi:hypothetical protein
MSKLRLGMAAAASVAALAVAGPSAADTREVFTFADPFDGGGQCDGFELYYEGHDHGTVTNFFNADGVPYRQIGHIHAIETDYNMTTGKSVVVRTNLTVRGELSPEGDLVSWSIMGEFNVGNLPKQGIVIHDTGVLVFDNGDLVAERGIHDVFDNADETFCNAVS